MKTLPRSRLALAWANWRPDFFAMGVWANPKAEEMHAAIREVLAETPTNVRRDAMESLYEIAEELRSYKPDHGNLHAAWAVQLSKALKKLEVAP